jgi:L-lactate dehydrogenase
MDLRRVMSVSVLLQGEYGIKGVAMSLPAVIGRDGAQRILTPTLTKEEEQKLKRSAADLQAAAGGTP